MRLSGEPLPGGPGDEPPDPGWPEWLGPPPAVMGGVVPLDEAVVRTEHVFIGLRAVTAYPSGLSLGLAVAARRGALPYARWEALRDSFWSDRAHRGGAPPEEGALRIGVELADGRRIDIHDGFGLGKDEEPEPPVFLERGGGGSGGARMMERRRELWLWPLPAGEALSLLVQWPDLDVPLRAHRLDLQPVCAAAGRALPYWP